MYGALGGRLDHTVANLQLLASFAERGLAVAAVGERERIAFLVGPGELRLPALPSGIVSVFSLTDVSTGVVEEGLKYGLDGVALTGKRHAGSVFAALALCRSLYWHYNHRLGELAAAWRPGRLRGGAEFAPTRKT